MCRKLSRQAVGLFTWMFMNRLRRRRLFRGREGVVVIPGVGDERAVDQLVNFSQGLARAGLVVMDMTTPTLLNYDLSYQDTDAVVQAFKTLANWPGVGAQRVGIIGFSGGNALAAFAAADPRVRDQVAFILCFGGYFNTATLLRDFGRRALDVNGQMQPWHPQYVPIEGLANVIAPLLPPNEASRLINAQPHSSHARFRGVRYFPARRGEVKSKPGAATYRWLIA
jgi:hypothetical protein